MRSSGGAARPELGVVQVPLSDYTLPSFFKPCGALALCIVFWPLLNVVGYQHIQAQPEVVAMLSGETTRATKFLNLQYPRKDHPSS
jgi:hypothetical protein